MIDFKNYNLPDDSGHFGEYGGSYVPETLVPALNELESAFTTAWKDDGFHSEFDDLLKNYSGRPTPLYFADKLSSDLGGAKIYLKREDLGHTGSHKINNTLGQALLAIRMGKKRIIAETGAGQHGLAVATVAAKFGLNAVVYMGRKDTIRQSLNVRKMKLLGAEVIPVDSGSKTLKDAINEAIRDWVTNVEDSFYMIGSVVGPHPYPLMVRNFQRIIGLEAKKQFDEAEGSTPAALVACVGGGSNSIGLFHPFLSTDAKLYGVEGGGEKLELGNHSASLSEGSPGVLHGSLSYILQDSNGQISPAESIAPGLDYPGSGPEHSYLKDCGRVQYSSVSDTEALNAFKLLSRTEGIIPAIESSHAIAKLIQIATDYKKSDGIIVCLSGRGDKDFSEEVSNGE
ncbi:tryptophan synthase subunit beta [Candidatus Marinimicrobia bacterium MT.SAG.3]|nr:tryptophan synthase subunit beta [Candidatus Marinimicrobia bacterium MT.SAG.3]